MLSAEVFLRQCIIITVGKVDIQNIFLSLCFIVPVLMTMLCSSFGISYLRPTIWNFLLLSNGVHRVCLLNWNISEFGVFDLNSA